MMKRVGYSVLYGMFAFRFLCTMTVLYNGIVHSDLVSDYAVMFSAMAWLLYGIWLFSSVIAGALLLLWPMTLLVGIGGFKHKKMRVATLICMTVLSVLELLPMAMLFLTLHVVGGFHLALTLLQIVLCVLCLMELYPSGQRPSQFLKQKKRDPAGNSLD